MANDAHLKHGERVAVVHVEALLRRLAHLQNVLFLRVELLRLAPVALQLLRGAAQCMVTSGEGGLSMATPACLWGALYELEVLDGRHVGAALEVHKARRIRV